MISLFLCPSVSPWQWYMGAAGYGPAHNPGIRLVKYDRRTGETRDILQYYLDYDTVNARKEARITDWYLAYNITTDYHLGDLNPPALFDLATRIRNNKTEWYNYMYFKWNLNATPADIDKSCNEDCRRSFICGLTSFNSRELQTCKELFDTITTTPSGARHRASVSSDLLIAAVIFTIIYCNKQLEFWLTL